MAVYKPYKKTSSGKEEIKIPYSSIDGTPTIPTKTSQLTNDSGFLTSHQDISGKANLNGGNTFTGKQLFNNTVNGVTNQLALNETQWDIFTCRDLTSPTTKTAIGKGFVWCQDSDAIYSQFKATGIYYGNDDRGCDCELLFPYIEDGASVEKTIATTDQIPDVSGKANLSGGNTFYGSQDFLLPNDGSFWISDSSDNTIFSVDHNGNINIGDEVPAPILLETDAGTSGQVLTSQGAGKTPQWTTPTKGTVRQVKINGTTKSPNSAGLVDLGTISGGGDNPLSTIELVAGDSIQVASPSAEGASYVKIIGATDLGPAETLEIDVFFTYVSTTRTILHKEITLDTSSKSVISLEFATVQDNNGYPIFIIKLSYGAVVETDYSTFGYGFDSITGVGFSYEDQANQSSIFTGIMIKEVEP